MNRYKHLSLVALLGLMVPLTAISADSSGSFPYKKYNRSGELVLEAERLIASEQYEEALEMYREARNILTGLLELYPNANKNLFNTRITGIDVKIERLERLLGKSSAPQATESLPSAGAVTPSATSAPAAPSDRNASARELVMANAEIQMLKTENAQLKEQILDAAQQLETVKRELRYGSATSEEVQNLLKEKRELQEKLNFKDNQIAELNKKIAAPEGIRTEYEARLFDAQRRADAATKKLDNYQSNLKIFQEEAAATKEQLVEQRGLVKDMREQLENQRIHLANVEGALQLSKNETAELSEKIAGLELAAKGKDEIIANYKESTALLEQRLLDAAGSDDAVTRLQGDLFVENKKLRENRDELRNRARELERDLQIQQDKVRSLNQKSTQDNDALKRALSEVESLNMEILRLSDDKEKLIVDNEKYVSDLQAQRERIEQLTADLLDSANKYDLLRHRLDSWDNSSEAIAEMNTAKISNLKTLLDERNADYAALQEKYNSLELQYSSAQQNARQLKQAVIDLQDEQAAAASEEAQALKKELEEQQAAYTKLQMASETTQEELRQLKAQIVELEAGKIDVAAVQQENQKYEEVQAKCQLAEQKLAVAEQQIKTLTEENDKLRGDDGVKNKIAELTDTNRQLREELTRALAGGGNTIPEMATGVALTPEQIRIMLDAAVAAELKDDAEVAIWHYQKVLETEPDNVAANRRLGGVFLKRDRYEEAAKHLQLALLRTPDDIDTAVDYAKALNAQRKYGNTLSLLGPFQEKNPDNRAILLETGIALNRSAQYAEAEKYLGKILEIQSRHPQANLEMARAIIHGDPAKVAESANHYRIAKEEGCVPDPELEDLLQSELNDKTETIEFLYQTAQEALESGDGETAIWYYQQLTDLDPSNPMPKYLTGYIFANSNRVEEALALLDRTGGSADSRAVEGFALVKGGRYGEAAAVFEAAAAASEGKPWQTPLELNALKLELNNFFASNATSDNADLQRAAQAFDTFAGQTAEATQLEAPVPQEAQPEAPAPQEAQPEAQAQGSQTK